MMVFPFKLDPAPLSTGLAQQAVTVTVTSGLPDSPAL